MVQRNLNATTGNLLLNTDANWSWPMRRLIPWYSAALMAGASALSLPAHATTTINVTNVSVPAYASGVSLSYGGSTFNNVISGQIVLYSNYAGAIASPAFDVYAWCVDLFHDINIGNHSYSYIVGGNSVTTDSNGNAVSGAVSNQLMTLAGYGNSLLAGADAGSADVSSAIQLSIWQTEYPGLTFTANADVTNLVATFEAYAASNSAPAATLNSTQGAQNLITDTIGVSGQTSSQQSVPEPASATLLGAALLALPWTRRRMG